VLTEIEDKLVKILQERVKEMPRENIVFNIEPSKLPAVTISNLGFKFENLDLAENIDRGRIELKESFNSDGVQTSYKLKEKPLQDSVHVECPPGTSLTEKKDFTINYDEGSIEFSKALPKGKNNVFVKYLSRGSVMTLKGLKVKALYSIDVLGADRVETDSIAENVIKALLTGEDELAADGIESKPVKGMVLIKEDGKTRKIRLKYMFEKGLRVEKIVGPIEKIEITSKNF